MAADERAQVPGTASTTSVPATERAAPVRWKKIAGVDDLKSLFQECEVRGDRFLIKPNWFDPRPGSYTDAGILDLVLSALPGEKFIIEGHSHSRNDLSQRITPDNMDAQREWIRGQERNYLDRLGLTRVMKRHGAEYINVTEEVWSGRTADPAAVRHIVENKFGPLIYQEFYGFVPERLFAMRGTTLIDLARVKMTSPTSRDFSLTMKNLFGLVPPPSRMAYHNDLPGSIVDVNKVYRALFDVVGLCEGIRHAVIFWEKGRYSTPWSRFDVIKDLGIAACGRDLVEVDVEVGRMFGQDLNERALLQKARASFGARAGRDLPNVPLLVDVSREWIGRLEAQGMILTDSPAV